MVNTCESTGPFDQMICPVNRYLFQILSTILSLKKHGTWNSFFWGGQVEWWWTMGYVCSFFLTTRGLRLFQDSVPVDSRNFQPFFRSTLWKKFCQAQVKVEGRNFHTGDTETWVLCGFIDSYLIVVLEESLRSSILLQHFLSHGLQGCQYIQDCYVRIFVHQNHK